MAHELEMNGEEASMAYVGSTPWHGLGTKVDSDLTPLEMLKAANLNWTVDKHPLMANIGNDQTIDVPGKQALVRSTDNKVLSIISDDWEPCQNYDAFKFFNEFIFAGDMEMHTAGSLFDGKMVWGLAKVNDSFELFDGKDRVESYLLFSNPHEYGKSIDIRFTPIRVVCNNTLTLSLSGNKTNMVKLNHRKKFDPAMVKSMLGVASKQLHTYKTVAEILSKKNFTETEVVSYFNDVFPRTKETEEGEPMKLSRPASVAMSVLETQPGHELGAGTWWQAFNAVTYSIDHLLGHKPETRLANSWYGLNRVKKLTALEKAHELATA